jgi:RNA polymerase sigma-70 factor (ECF subfamily)
MSSSANLCDDDMETDIADRMLLRRMSAGDRDALGQLYRSYHGELCHFLSRMTRQPEVIDEVINDCFWIACREADSFYGDFRVFTWIVGIAYRCGLKALRQHGDTFGGDRAIQEQSTDANHLGEGRELLDWLNKGLNHLPVDQRVVIELIYGMGLSPDDVADVMQCPVRTAKARLFHARAKLRDVLST